MVGVLDFGCFLFSAMVVQKGDLLGVMALVCKS